VRKQVRTWRSSGERIGFVPTMGALHAGHRSLLVRARRECDRLVASVFVNPMQFGPGEDYRRYPRPVARDNRMLREVGTDLLYAPPVGVVYPPDFQTRLAVERVSAPMEGRFRPGHFDGVATVVAKLLAAVEPDRLYLGQKDAQQAVVIDRMVRDLDLGVRVVVCPTVREPDGLACSSRNAYLSAEERAWAPALYAALREAAEKLKGGGIRTPGAAENLVRHRLAKGPGRLQYVAAVHARTLGPMKQGDPILIALAYRLGTARLIDNVVVRRGSRGVVSRRGRGHR
jgi:pantoate--beta-alanine ligase